LVLPVGAAQMRLCPLYGPFVLKRFVRLAGFIWARIREQLAWTTLKGFAAFDVESVD
jgi:hypothetical protein